DHLPHRVHGGRRRGPRPRRADQRAGRQRAHDRRPRAVAARRHARTARLRHSRPRARVAARLLPRLPGRRPHPGDVRGRRGGRLASAAVERGPRRDAQLRRDHGRPGRAAGPALRPLAPVQRSGGGHVAGRGRTRHTAAGEAEGSAAGAERARHARLLRPAAAAGGLAAPLPLPGVRARHRAQPPPRREPRGAAVRHARPRPGAGRDGGHFPAL
ncbi:MAG: hypothetical protein AVDCRST_MAG68-347, partial [uncultured Gemmatimonadetes bacterium]